MTCYFVALTFAAGTLAMTASEVALKDDHVLISHGACLLSVSLRSPRLMFQGMDGGTSETPPAAVQGDLSSGAPVVVTYDPVPVGDVGLVGVRMHLQWSPGERILRKWAVLDVLKADEVLLLEEVIFDALDASAMLEDPRTSPPRSTPVFLPGFFAGIEFPVASTRVEGGRALIGHSPMTTLQQGDTYETRRAVYGATEPKGERAAFHRYIEHHRPTPKGLHINYNSWWTSPVPFSEQNILDLMAVFERELYARHGVALDSFTIDLGWSNPESIWEIDSELFPEGFTHIQAAAERMGARLGLWISPSSFYPPALDPDWARGQGYESFSIPWGEGRAELLSLAGERYRTRFREGLVEMVARFGIRQIKLDGYFLGHGFEAGPFSAEATAQGGIEAFEAVRAVAPDTWLECTFDANASPWWLFHLNSVIGGFGDDSPYGRVPCPVYRESYTTARDYFNLQAADRLFSPIVAQEILGIIHQSEESFMNDAVMTVMRGHAFLPLYVNPKFMNEARWASLAALLRWARANEHVLLDAPTRPLRPEAWEREGAPWFSHDAPMPRTPYGYAHWTGDGGLVVLRNPWIAPQTYALKVSGDLGGTGEGAVFSIASLYPESRRYASGARPGAVIDIPLAPYETVVLCIAPTDADPGLPDVEASVGGQISVEASAHRTTLVLFDDDVASFGPDWTALEGDAESLLEVMIEACLNVSAPESRLLVLAEGSAQTPRIEGEVYINGVPAVFTEIRSDHGFAASSIPPSEHWTFLEASLPEGACEVALTVRTADALTDLTAWVWAFKGGSGISGDPGALPGPERISLDGAALLPPGACIRQPVREKRSRRIDRIDGIYLDALEPVSHYQGWGTLQRNRSIWERPMTIAGRHFRRGLGVHAVSEVTYALDGTCRTFEAMAGVDGANNGTITFEVYVDGEKRWESGRMARDDAARPVIVDVAGASELRLVVGDGGDGISGDHANWADAKLLR